MEASESSSSSARNDSSSNFMTTTTNGVRSDEAVSTIMQQGLMDIVVSTATGCVLGGVAGIVLSGKGGGAGRRMYAGLGAGIGGGVAWTRTSILLENLVVGQQQQPKNTTTATTTRNNNSASKE